MYTYSCSGQNPTAADFFLQNHRASLFYRPSQPQTANGSYFGDIGKPPRPSLNAVASSPKFYSKASIFYRNFHDAASFVLPDAHSTVLSFNTCSIDTFDSLGNKIVMEPGSLDKKHVTVILGEPVKRSGLLKENRHFRTSFMKALLVVCGFIVHRLP